MSRRFPSAVLVLSAICLPLLLGGCKRDSAVAEAPQSPAARTQPQSRFDMANDCFAVQSLRTGTFLQRTDDGRYRLGTGELTAAEPLFMKPTALGDYLLQAKDQSLMALVADGVGSQAVASDASVWTVESKAPGRFVLFSAEAGRVLATDNAGRLVLAEPASAGPAAEFRFLPASGCTAYPEMPVGMDGQPYRGRGVRQPVVGFAEVHTHMAMGHEMSDGSRVVGPSAGGTLYGQMFHRFGVPHALHDCAAWHGPQGVRDPEALVLDMAPLTTHDTQGWPSFIDWPAYDSQLHQGMYYKWVERAWRAGLRIMVSEGTNIAALCEVGRLAVLRPDADCNDMRLGIKQVQYLFELQNYVDAQWGGPGKGWFRIVRSPAEARQVINDGKLAVVAGLEFSNVFDCTVRYDALGNETSGCTREDVDRQIEEVWDLGVREIFPYHDVDTALGGTGIFSGDALNLVNFVGTGRFWTTYDCPDGGEGEAYFYPAGAYMTTAVPGTGNDPISNALISLTQGKLPLYAPDRRQCNARGMTELGEYVVRKMMEKGFVIDIDHAELSIKSEMIRIAKEQTPYYPLISAHGGHGGISMQQARDLMEIGGLIYPFMPNGKGFKAFLDKMKPVWPASRGPLPLGYGMDANGIADRAPPRGAGSQPVRYPFTLFQGEDWGPQFAGMAPVTVQELRIPESGKRWNINEVGMAHYGLVPDWVEEVRIEGGREALNALYHSAEAYLQMWERTYNR